MDSIRALIVDDEALARENLRLRLQGVADFEIVGECASGGEAIAAIAHRRPDVVFLDIQMPDMSGFSVIERTPPEAVPIIVFVTAYDRFALDAFRVHALDYLLKPFDDGRFAEALEACRARIAEARTARRAGEPTYRLSGAVLADGAAGTLGHGLPPGPLPDRLVIKARGRVFFLETSAIDWIEAAGDYARLHSGERSYLLRRTMSQMASCLDPRTFVRISRSAIINLDRVRDLLPISRGAYLVRLVTGAQVKLTPTYRERLEARLGDRL